MWCRSATQTGLTSLVDRFNASQDNLTVELTPVLDEQYVTKLATAIRGRAVPDLVDIDDINSMLFIYRDAFTDLSKPLAELDFADRLSPGHLRLATRNGRQYGIPYLADNSLLWCNTELFDRAGVDVDESTKTFDGLTPAWVSSWRCSGVSASMTWRRISTAWRGSKRRPVASTSRRVGPST